MVWLVAVLTRIEDHWKMLKHDVRRGQMDTRLRKTRKSHGGFYHCWLAWVRVFGTGETQRWKYPCMTLGDRVERHGLWIGATKSSLHGGEQRLRWSIAGQVQGGLWERQVPLPPPYFFLNTRHTVNRQSNGSHSCFVGVCGGNGLVGRQLACVVLWLGSRQT